MTDKDEPNVPISKQGLRLMKLLAKATQKNSSIQRENGRVIVCLNSRGHSFELLQCERLAKQGLITFSETDMSLTSQGRLTLRAALQQKTDTGLARVGNVETRTVMLHGQPQTVLVNADESPLDRLHKRRRNDGTRYISDQEFQAGERIRFDFHKANLQPSISSNWSMTAGQAGKGGKSVSEEISDIAIDARTRFQTALDQLGPDLAGVVVDVCCFLKGLEAVKRERQWPPRSAKLMLKTALASLARHYGLTIGARKNRADILNWGSDNYRPAL